MISQRYAFYNELEIQFSTDNAGFFGFVQQDHGLQPAEPGQGEPDLNVQVYFYKKKSLSLDKRLAYNVFFDEGQILYEDRGFSVHAEQGEPFRITVHVHKELARDVYHILRYGMQGAKQGKYLEIVRKSLYLPVLYLLEKRGYTLLHGSAVVNAQSDKAYIFLGANYVGKTTTVLQLILCKEKDFGFLSDNYILVKDGKIYPFPNEIRAKKDVLDMLAIQTKKDAVSEKYFVGLVRKILKPWPLSKTFFMQLGPNVEINPIDQTAALNRLNACHNYLGEFPEYSYLAFFPDFPSIAQIQSRLAEFLQGQELFVFQGCSDIKKNMETLVPHLT